MAGSWPPHHVDPEGQEVDEVIRVQMADHKEVNVFWARDRTQRIQGTRPEIQANALGARGDQITALVLAWSAVGRAHANRCHRECCVWCHVDKSARMGDMMNPHCIMRIPAAGCQMPCYTTTVSTHRRVIAGCVLSLLGAIALGGCGQTTYHGPDLTVGRSAQQLLGATRTHTAARPQFGLTTNSTIAIALTPAAAARTSYGQFLSGRQLPIHGTGVVVRPDQFSLALGVTIGGVDAPFTLIHTRGQLYVLAAGRTVRVVRPVTDTSVPTLNALIDAMRMPTRVGRTSIGGVPAVEIAGQLNGASLAPMIANGLATLPSLGTTPISLPALAHAIDQGTAHIWVRVRDLATVRMQILITIPTTIHVTPALRNASIDLALDLTDLATPPRITAPAHATPMSLAQLRTLLTG